MGSGQLIGQQSRSRASMKIRSQALAMIGNYTHWKWNTMAKILLFVLHDELGRLQGYQFGWISVKMASGNRLWQWAQL